MLLQCLGNLLDICLCFVIFVFQSFDLVCLFLEEAKQSLFFFSIKTL